MRKAKWYSNILRDRHSLITTYRKKEGKTGKILKRENVKNEINIINLLPIFFFIILIFFLNHSWTLNISVWWDNEIKFFFGGKRKHRERFPVLFFTRKSVTVCLCAARKNNMGERCRRQYYKRTKLAVTLISILPECVLLMSNCFLRIGLIEIYWQRQVIWHGWQLVVFFLLNG